jgi:hypothetical protein
MSYSRVLVLLGMSLNSPMKWLLTCPCHGLSPSQQQDCLAKMSKLVMGLALSAIGKYIELVTSAEAEVGNSVGMVGRLETRLSRPWGVRTGWTLWRSG